MGIWLRRASDASGDDAPVIGTDSEVIRRDALGVLLELDAACEQVRQDRVRLLDQARNEAAGMIAAAEVNAAALLAEARKHRDEAAEQGYREGRQQALSEWMGHLAEAGDLRRRVQLGMRERMAEVVTLTVERIVRTEGTRALFARALDTIEQIIEDTVIMRIAVHPDDHAEARKIFGILATRWRKAGRSFPLRIVKDPRLARGSCLCESDLVIVDVGVDARLQAVRLAAGHALSLPVDDAAGTDRDGDAN
ncbi:MULTISPECIES: type III secretion system stator protein SctL [Burkholderia]|uniref:Flagellar assembly protein FliH n=1 Tax=Burkholderia pyrrocinia TaxID=60550 RepID=A0A318I2Y2_BURPY|nr:MULTISPECIES: type III secretion system stator protein SctL [Burkholderia]PXX21937.1 type III secretion protein L [Burkholderia pyrrocinia]SFW89891.1 type III secretion protein L [Burkholderia sp. NFACC33-1]SFY46354.1 type III secretion protein L [Burkholderia sp. NFPP32]